MKTIEALETETKSTQIYDLNYLSEMVGGKKKLISEIIDTFLIQVPEELKSISDAIEKSDFVTIKTFAHTMKSSLSIMGISMVIPVLEEMEELAFAASDIKKIKELDHKLNSICEEAMCLIKKENVNYL